MAKPQTILYPEVARHEFGFQSAEIRVNNKVFRGITEYAFGSTLEPGQVRGTSPRKLGRTRGILTDTLSFTIQKREYENLRRTVAPNGLGYMEFPFLFQAQMYEVGHTPITDECIGVRITGDEELPGNAESAESAKVRVTCDVMILIRSGEDPAIVPGPSQIGV